jgi:hypothetical protein
MLIIHKPVLTDSYFQLPGWSSGSMGRTMGPVGRCLGPLEILRCGMSSKVSELSLNHVVVLWLVLVNGRMFWNFLVPLTRWSRIWNFLSELTSLLLWRKLILSALYRSPAMGGLIGFNLALYFPSWNSLSCLWAHLLKLTVVRAWPLRGEMIRLLNKSGHQIFDWCVTKMSKPFTDNSGLHQKRCVSPGCSFKCSICSFWKKICFSLVNFKYAGSSSGTWISKLETHSNVS